VERTTDAGLEHIPIWESMPGLRDLWFWWVALRNEISARRPSQVAQGLWVGGVATPHRWRVLQGLGVSAVVMLTREFPPPRWYHSASHILWLPVLDRACPNRSQLAAGCDFVERCQASEVGVFVSCGSGVGRAPTLCAAWLIRRGQPRHRALDTLRQARSVAAPTPEQRLGLQGWETAVHTANSEALGHPQV